jgi:predicted AAA+ superfamily ATPase
MERHILQQLQKWKDRPDHKPLILRGARQVGKTWALREFGSRCFESCVYLRLEDNAEMSRLFSGSLTPQRLLAGISAATGQAIVPGQTLLILDEIQAVPRALTALKYFHEEAPHYDIAAAGSLLGISLHEGISFPVGKVNFLNLYPLSFTEYLEASGESSLLDIIRQSDFEMMSVFSERFIDLLNIYLYIGGMPEVVQTFIASRDFARARAVQNDILRSYDLDFSKHIKAPLSERCREIWDSAPKQLGKENKKFIYGAIRKGARGREYNEVIQLLVDCGLVTKVARVTKAGIPLKSYEDATAFKMFIVDVGLLAAMAGLDSRVILEGSRLYEEFKGALAEQFVCQQMVSDCGLRPYYWTAEQAKAEVDFVFQDETEVVPVEVKAQVNLKSKSLASFCKTYALKNAVRLSLADYKQQDWLTNLPLYATACLPLKSKSEAPLGTARE